VLKYITLPFPRPLTINTTSMPNLNLVADAEKWFLPDTVSFKKITVIMAPGVKAKQVAGNYQHMFRITGVTKP